MNFNSILKATCVLLGLSLNINLSAKSPVNNGFKALAVYDYFKAKQNFYKAVKGKTGFAACYGLAIIYSRHDNPFTHLDSATRYINLSYANYRFKRPQKTTFSGFTADSLHILALADTIANMQLEKAKKLNTVLAFESFLMNNYLCHNNSKSQAVYLRDELEFNQLMQVNHSDSSYFFMLTHPGSYFYRDAALLRERQLYDEITRVKTADSYVLFLKKHPDNVMVKQAYEKLFGIYRQNSDVSGLAQFVKEYPKAPQNLEAWKLLFSLSVKAYSFAELKRFLGEFPEFPLKNSILKELELNKQILYAYQAGDYTGFINEAGKVMIEPVYDEASDFSEGLSVVHKNDSVFFINKENINPFDLVFEDAMAFKNGIAPVKSKNKWHFINRQGQVISENYDEINELSNSVYVFKQNEKYGALDQYGQTLIKPVYEKLGDFKNDFAYCAWSGGYGFVSLSGEEFKPELDWISDFDEEQIAIMRQGNKYGLINGKGKKLLECRYDLLVKASPGIFMVVSNNQYGFYKTSGCFITQLNFDYQKDKSPEFYTNGKQFRLLKKKGQYIVDENGNTLITTSEFVEINFLCNGLMCVKKKKKFGYLDRKLTTAIPFKFEQAGDFSDSLALVLVKGKYSLINLQGKEVYTDLQPIKKLSTHLYETSGEVRTLINQNGQVLATGISSINRLNQKLWVVTLVSGEIRLIND